ncbi:UvrD-helicase domain-containing protein [Oceanivirga miroungae]|uniref:DNA 3'-5' helicase n=1 Tax=Oceanivirga miroungae TaxID=1130046 RepID=A0A6I8M5R9_9FUSO|nr:UvrD-helicase domain-containing protein [Oceanivirga miroungae]VWL85279.1 UvrD/REP helicase [Oceanivirga miroungae]
MKAKIINASAGTGKTYTMAIEYLKALNKGVKYDEIQVITFTKKATSEIKERVIKFLYNIIFEENNYEDIIKSMGVKINHKLLKEVYFDMIKNSENIKISTNDAFINKIFKLAIAPYKNIYSYEVLSSDDDNLIQTILEKLIENDYEEFKELYMFNSKKKIDELKEIIKDGIIKNRNVLYHLINKESDLLNNKKYDLELMKEDLLKEFSEFSDIVFENESRGKLNVFSVSKDLIERIKNSKNAKSLIKVFNEFKNKSFITTTYVKTSSAFYNEAVKINEIVENKKEAMCELYLEDVIYKYNIIYRKIAKKVYDYLEEINFRERRFTFSDISFYTDKYFSEKEIGLVKNGFAQDKLYDIIGSNIKVFMIDEFQDTDNVQLKIFMPLLRNCQEVLIVGDYKQAIYAFRGANSSIFKNISSILEKNIADIEIETKSLNTCYRTRENIVEYVNNKFLNLENYDYENVGYVKDKGHVEVIEVKKEEAKNDGIFSVIANKLKGNENKSAAILFNTNNQISKMSYELYKNNMEYNSIESMLLVKDKNIKVIKLLIDYLVTKDTYKLLEFLRSDLIQMSINDVKKFIDNKLEENSIIKSIRSLEKNSSDFKRKYISSFGYSENMSDDEIININNFLDLVDKANNLKDFYDNYDKNLSGIKKVNSKNQKAINILTIHSSKGLEYDDIHILHEFKKDDLKDFKIAYKRENGEIIDYLFIKKRAIIEETKVGKEFVEYFREDELENSKNLAYVGLTRPKNNLYVYYIEGKEEDNYLKLKGEKVSSVYEDNEIGNDIENVKEIEFSNSMFYTKTEYEESKKTGIKNSLKMELKRKNGLALHYYMQYIKSKEDMNVAKSMLYKRYANLIGPSETKKLIEKANLFIENNEDMYDIKKYEIYNEFEIKDDEYNLYRIDRVNIDNKNKKIIIFDYKTEKNAENNKVYKEQIAKYKEIIEGKKGYEGYDVQTKLVSIEL